MWRRLGAVGAMAVIVGAATVAHADGRDVIDTTSDAAMGALAVPVAQNFRPAITGRVVRVTLWSADEMSGQPGVLTLHRGDRPGAPIAEQPFAWYDRTVTIELDRPPTVEAGAAYTLMATGAVAGVTFSVDDPYPNGEIAMEFDGSWATWTEWNGCDTGGFCLPYFVDQRLVIEIENGDADGDGIADDDDQCPDTVLPDPSVDALRRGRLAATEAGFVDRAGRVRGTLEDTHGCSATQIVDLLHLGNGQRKYGITRANFDRWLHEAHH